MWKLYTGKRDESFSRHSIQLWMSEEEKAEFNRIQDILASELFTVPSCSRRGCLGHYKDYNTIFNITKNNNKNFTLARSSDKNDHILIYTTLWRRGGVFQFEFTAEYFDCHSAYAQEIYKSTDLLDVAKYSISYLKVLA